VKGDLFFASPLTIITVFDKCSRTADRCGVTSRQMRHQYRSPRGINTQERQLKVVGRKYINSTVNCIQGGKT